MYDLTPHAGFARLRLTQLQKICLQVMDEFLLAEGAAGAGHASVDAFFARLDGDGRRRQRRERGRRAVEEDWRTRGEATALGS